ncbi:hypothetical protein IWQ60_008895 [Tieghemiomyces parasiticus]|uniref:Uncharacterized protein n=1 Tax=Tieghemiomyces parasiticus TaxID=78921 RepID=A0A9W8DR44_9FUNG|nr:hypothetical protein IWQ60_008895 [Tieghemiomyces parasiticus]
MLDVKDKIAVITGAAAGFGLLLAQRLVRKGARVVLGDVNITGGEKLAAELNASTARSSSPSTIPRAVFQKCDVSHPAEIHALFDLGVQTFGTVDIMVNNAGILEYPAYFDQDDESVSQRVLDINLKAVLSGTHYAVRYWRKRGQPGVVVNASSASAFALLPIATVYATAKAAVLHFTSNCISLRTEGIRVNAIAPYFSPTSLVNDSRKADPTFDKLLNNIPMVSQDMVVDAYMRCIEDEDLAGK